MSGYEGALIVVGAALAIFSLGVAFEAGSDRARITGNSRILMVGAISLTIAALMLEYHAHAPTTPSTEGQGA